MRGLRSAVLLVFVLSCCLGLLGIMGFFGVIAGRNAVFVCKLARYDFTGERGYFCTDAFATGKHKHEAREQQDCRKGRGD